jgi:hypothetical protein
MTVQIYDHILVLTTSTVMADQAVSPFVDRETHLQIQSSYLFFLSFYKTDRIIKKKTTWARLHSIVALVKRKQEYMFHSGAIFLFYKPMKLIGSTNFPFVMGYSKFIFVFARVLY